jgi:hypothetical protein
VTQRIILPLSSQPDLARRLLSAVAAAQQSAALPGAAQQSGVERIQVQDLEVHSFAPDEYPSAVVVDCADQQAVERLTAALVLFSPVIWTSRNPAARVPGAGGPVFGQGGPNTPGGPDIQGGPNILGGHSGPGDQEGPRRGPFSIN